jgi:hypothetical protein
MQSNVEVVMASEDKSLSEFLQAFDERKRKENGRAQMEVQAIERKRKALGPLRAFLQKFVDLGLVVPDSGVGNPGVSMGATKPFNFFESESSPTWAPGVSLYFDHPAEVEISIPNESDKEKQGVVVIRSVTSHKDRIILHQKFTSIDQAKDALAKFLGKNAVAIENDPRKKRVQMSSRADEGVLKNVPSEPPKE